MSFNSVCSLTTKRQKPTGFSDIKLDVEVVLKDTASIEVKVLCCIRPLGGAWLEFSGVGKNTLFTVPESNLLLK